MPSRRKLLRMMPITIALKVEINDALEASSSFGSLTPSIQKIVIERNNALKIKAIFFQHWIHIVELILPSPPPLFYDSILENCVLSLFTLLYRKGVCNSFENVLSPNKCVKVAIDESSKLAFRNWKMQSIPFDEFLKQISSKHLNMKKKFFFCIRFCELINIHFNEVINIEVILE